MGIETFAINSNVSDGQMFSPNKFLGGPIDARYARRQQENEPLFEICQLVGNTVDVKKATYTNDIGDSQLATVWTDPDFDPNL